MRYTLNIDNFDRDEWERCARDFADYSIYQTWAYQKVRGNMDKQDISRVIIKDEQGQAVLMCQLRIKRVKLLGVRVGYAQWGPLIRRKNGEIKCSTKMLELLREAYVGPRVNVLRVVPNVYADEAGDSVADMFRASGFEYLRSVAPYRTLMVLLDTTEQEMRSRLHRKWRSVLRRAERQNIKIKEGPHEEYLRILKELYISAQNRKKFKGLDVDVYIRTQQLLSPEQKMNIMLAYDGDEPLTADVTSCLGDTAVGIFHASGEKGLRCGASYLVWWRTLLAARRSGMKTYDLGGIDPDNNPTVYRFKAKMGTEEAFHIGAFEAWGSSRARYTWRTAKKIHDLIRR